MNRPLSTSGRAKKITTSGRSSVPGLSQRRKRNPFPCEGRLSILFRDPSTISGVFLYRSPRTTPSIPYERKYRNSGLLVFSNPVKIFLPEQVTDASSKKSDAPDRTLWRSQTRHRQPRGAGACGVSHGTSVISNVMERSVSREKSRPQPQEFIAESRVHLTLLPVFRNEYRVCPAPHLHNRILQDLPRRLPAHVSKVKHDAVDDGRVLWQVDMTEHVGARVLA